MGRSRNKSSQAVTAERIAVSALVKRLQENAMGELMDAQHVMKGTATQILELIKKLTGVEVEMNRTQKLQLGKLVSDKFKSIKMDSAAVKSAEILLKKRLPDVSQVEYKGEITTNHVVRLPSPQQDADAWSKSILEGSAERVERQALEQG